MKISAEPITSLVTRAGMVPSIVRRPVPVFDRGRILIANAILLAATPAAAEPAAGACTAATTTQVLVQVTGLSGAGRVRVQAYDEAGFLKKGRGIVRSEGKVAGRTTLLVCLALPVPGRYAVAVRHDANANGHSDWNDGGGFSRNPKLSLLNLRPSFASTVVEVRSGSNRLHIVMNYRRGLRIGPA